MRPRLAALLLAAAASFAQDADDVAERFLEKEREAFEHYNARDFGRAIAAFERQIAIFPENPRPYYNIACCYALQADEARAATWLSLSIAHGWRDAEHLAGDPDFDAVRKSNGYLACLAQLGRAREADPDPLPKRLPPGSVPPAPTLRGVAAASALELALLDRMSPLLEQHEYRKRLFDIYDRRMAVLARYLMENGDTLEAPRAAAERVRTALLYLAEAEGGSEADRTLRRVAAEYALETVDQFLRGWPGDAQLPEVLLARAVALSALDRDEEALEVLRAVRADHAGAAAATRAAVELCALLARRGPSDELRAEFLALAARARGDAGLALLVRRRLMEARLYCEGMPNLLDLDPAGAVAARVDTHDGPLAFVFVAYGSTACERRLDELPRDGKTLPIVVVIDGREQVTDLELETWLREHARTFPVIARGADAVERLWLRTVPTVVVARKDGTVVDVDPEGID